MVNEKYMEKVLIIAYHFPPMGGAASLRTEKFVKYLPKYSWEPVVLTVCSDVHNIVDLVEYKTQLSDFDPNVKVYRTITLSFKVLINRFKRLWADQKKTKANNDRAHNSVNIIIKAIMFFRKKLDMILQIPDYASDWIIVASIKAIYLIFKYKIKVYFTTSAPYSCHIVGLIIKILTHKKWIADFRDAWTLNPMNKYADLTILHRLVSGCFEPLVMRYADKIIMVSEPIRAQYLLRYKWLPPKKVSVITNGYDPDDIQRLDQLSKDPCRFTVVYNGSFYSDIYSPKMFLRAVALFLSERPEARSKIRLIFVGKFGGNEAYIDENGLNEIVEIKGNLPHEKSLQYLALADIFLLIIPGEYVASRAEGGLFD